MKKMKNKKNRLAAGRQVRPSASGYNESAIAREIGYSASTVHRVLSGERLAGPNLQRALSAIGVAI